MLKDEIEEYKRNGGEVSIGRVECPYCHQWIMVEASPSYSLDDEETRTRLAIENCDCPDAEYEASRLARYERLDEKLDKMFGEGTDTALPHETLEAVRTLARQVCSEDISKMTVNIDQNVKLLIYLNSKGLLNIKKEIKNVEVDIA